MLKEDMTLEEKLQQLNPDNLPDEKKVSDWKEKAESNLTDAGYCPNNNQLGVAITAIHKFPQ